MRRVWEVADGTLHKRKHPQQIYSCKTYNAFGKNHCTQHRIDYDTLYSHVLRKSGNVPELP